MISTILTASGLSFRESFFPRLPAETCVVYQEDVELDGPDAVAPPEGGLPCIYHHDVLLELYALKADSEAEAALETAIRAQGLTFKKYSREWVSTIQRYMTNYELSYTSKF